MKNLSKYIDLFFCVIVLPVMVIMFPIERWYHHFQTYMLCLGSWLYCLYFTNRLFTVPLLFKGKRCRMLAALLIFISLLVTYIFSSVYLYTPPYNQLDEGIVRIFPKVKQYQQAVWSLFVIVEAFSFAVGLLIQTDIQKSRRIAVEAERDKAELALYKARIKPHFLFNTLNSIYGLFITRNSRALPSLELFIQMMRYIHTSASKDEVPMEEETNYIREYVGLQRLRLNDKTRVNLEISLETPSVKVAPMILVTFVENCFKHGTSPIERSNISIHITERRGFLTLLTSNRIFPVIRTGEQTGLRNCRNRLRLMYPDRYNLSIDQLDNIYKVKLNIQL